jgi:hypothetical protein
MSEHARVEARQLAKNGHSCRADPPTDPRPHPVSKAHADRTGAPSHAAAAAGAAALARLVFVPSASSPW